MIEKLVISVVLAVLKFWQLPRVLREKRAPLLVDEVVRDPAGGTFAIFVKYYGRDFDAGQLALLESLKAERVNIIVVFNRQPEGRELEIARQYSWRVMIRKNVGRDFGAYRSAVLNLMRSGVAVDRLLFLNDSVFYLPGRQLGEMMSQLIHSDWPVTGALENHAHWHHVGSFVFAISGEVYQQTAFRAFWQDYRPYDLRQHAIRQGEIGLSRLYRRMNFSVDVIYSLDRLGEQLSARPFADSVSLLRTLPLTIRTDLVGVLRSPAALMTLMFGNDMQGRAGQRDTRTPSLSQFMTSNSLSADAVMPGLVKNLLIDRLLTDAAQGSQIHLAFGLYRRLLSMPLVKRDLLHQGVYAEHDMSYLLDDVADDFRHRIIRSMVAGQRPIHIGRFRAHMRRHGFN